MRLPWSKTSGSKSIDSGPVTKSQAALSGPDGDGKEHDLQYWLDSGFLTLPKPNPDAAPIASEQPAAPAPSQLQSRPAPRIAPTPTA